MSRYKHVIFDFDGVLCDSLNAAICAFNDVRSHGFESLPRVCGKSDMSIVYAGQLSTCLYSWLSPSDTRRFFDLHSAQMAQLAPTLKTFDGVGAMLASLPGGASVVTSAYSTAVETVLCSDQSYVSTSVSRIAGRELRQTKTQKILAILQERNLTSSEAVYVGDLESDIIYCRAVPIDIIAVGYGYHESSYLSTKSPTLLADSVDELHALLAQTCGNAGDSDHE